jgi:hypothetical protein
MLTWLPNDNYIVIDLINRSMLRKKKSIIFYYNPKNDLNVNKNLKTSQMVHCLLVKMTNQIVLYFANKKYHPSHTGQIKINLSKSNCSN